MAKNIEVPVVPEVVKNKQISEESENNLLEWKKAFEKLGCIFIMEEEGLCLVNLKESGTLAQILFPIFPRSITVSDFGYCEGFLSIGNKANISFVQISGKSDNVFEQIEEEFKSPITREIKEGTWEEIFNIVTEYREFREKLIPFAPHDD